MSNKPEPGPAVPGPLLQRDVDEVMRTANGSEMWLRRLEVEKLEAPGSSTGGPPDTAGAIRGRAIRRRSGAPHMLPGFSMPNRAGSFGALPASYRSQAFWRTMPMARSCASAP